MIVRIIARRITRGIACGIACEIDSGIARAIAHGIAVSDGPSASRLMRKAQAWAVAFAGRTLDAEDTIGCVVLH